MPTPLRASLAQLADTFASQVLAAIRGASIAELVAESAGAGGSAARPALARTPKHAPKTNGASTSKATAQASASPTAPAAKAKKAKGRLARRTPEQIAATLTQVVALVRKSTGMRAEEIQKALKLDRREVPRVLQLGLSTKKLKSKGVKRATTYSVG